MSTSELLGTPLSELKIGMSAQKTRTLTQRDIYLYAEVSGDTNPAHLDPDYAEGTRFKGIIGHGMWTAGLFSSLLANELPGPGTIYLNQSLSFRKPVYLGDVITASVTVLSIDAEKMRVTFETKALNQKGEAVLIGEAQVMPPTEKIRWKRPILPSITVGTPGRELSTTAFKS